MSELRIGLGVDAHAFERGLRSFSAALRSTSERPCRSLGRRLIAHSLTDAVLGAAGLGDIGSLFPPGDERWHGADSLHLLRDASASA